MFNFSFSLLSYFLYLIPKYRKSFYNLQQNAYNEGNRQIKWISKNKGKVFSNELLIYVILLPLGLIIPTNGFLFITFVVNFFLCYVEIDKKNKEKTKLEFKVTSRIKRMILTMIIIFGLLATSLILCYKVKYLVLFYFILMLLAYFSDYLVVLINYINKPIEKCVYFHYLNKAKRKLNEMHSLIKIGVTGSYGKTSSKNIINDILSVKYDSFATKKSMNTPYGLMISINNHLSKFNEVFIAEMGAYKLGEIKTLCNFVKPRYGVITKIGPAHLESFKTIENTIKTKFELLESLPLDGVCVLNGDDPNQVKYQRRNTCKVIWIGIDNKDVDIRAENIKLSADGNSFDVIFKEDKKRYHFNTSLLGKFNVYNILCGIALGREFNIDIKDLQSKVSNLKPTEHRLELKKYNNVNIIDDAFNSNPEGSKMALEVLNLMDGKKIVVTPGMIELGNREYELNKEFGRQISEVADSVILVGEKQTKPIKDGLLDKNFKESDIYVLNDVKDALKLITTLYKGNVYALLENDLPDIFNEK